MSKGTVARALIVGRMGDLINVKQMNNGKQVGEFSLAVSQGYGDKVETSWFKVQLFGDKKIEVIEKYTEKGSRLMVDGELKIREYTHQGQRKWATEVIVGFDGIVEIIDGRKDGSEGSGRQRPRDDDRGGTSGQQRSRGFDDDLEDDVPF
jgi:single-strand DNA-binding protein